MTDKEIINDTIDIVIEVEKGMVAAIHAVDQRYVDLKIAIIDLDQTTVEEAIDYIHVDSSINYISIYNAQMNQKFIDPDDLISEEEE